MVILVVQCLSPVLLTGQFCTACGSRSSLRMTENGSSRRRVELDDAIISDGYERTNNSQTISKDPNQPRNERVFSALTDD